MDPVSRFQTEYKKAFRALVEDFLARAVKASGIDRRENAALAKRIRQKEHALSRAKSGRGRCLFLTVLFLIVGGVATALLITRDFPERQTMFLAAYWILALLLIFCKLIPDLCRLNRLIPEVTATRDALIAAAQEKLRPFYQQFDWNTPMRLIERLLPEIKFDDYLPHRLPDDLQKRYRLDFAGLMQNRSMLFTHSGTFFGYPFLFYNTRRFQWGEETYTGTKRITWTTRERGADGKMRTCFHSQTLVASVTKPCPRFTEEKQFLFAHPAAPNLSFFRKPSELSGGEGFFHRMRKRSKRRKLKAFEANLTDESNYTMVSNEEFEILFDTANRNHEVEFRVLFTPLAQQQMVKLLNDTSVGYGDDFSYIKQRGITVISPEHLNALPFSTEPAVLPFYDFREVLRFYFSRYEEFFRSLYFTFAPLYTIPAYQMPAPEEEKPVAGPPSRWELEAIANWQGERYAHPESCTENLYRVVSSESDASGRTTAEVIAAGFRGTERIEWVPVFGRDGNLHRVAVPWVEYDEVRRRSVMSVSTDAAAVPADCATVTRRGVRILPE